MKVELALRLFYMLGEVITDKVSFKDLVEVHIRKCMHTYICAPYTVFGLPLDA